MTKLHVEITDAVMTRIIGIAAKEFSGNISRYVRIAIYADLFRRDMMTFQEIEILRELDK